MRPQRAVPLPWGLFVLRGVLSCRSSFSGFFIILNRIHHIPRLWELGNNEVLTLTLTQKFKTLVTFTPSFVNGFQE